LPGPDDCEMMPVSGAAPGQPPQKSETPNVSGFPFAELGLA